MEFKAGDLYMVVIDYYHCNEDGSEEWTEPVILKVTRDGLLAFDKQITKNTKVFVGKDEAKKYIVNHGMDKACYGENARAVALDTFRR